MPLLPRENNLFIYLLFSLVLLRDNLSIKLSLLLNVLRLKQL